MIKTAFVTGAASGIGRSTVEALYAKGWTLGLADINVDVLKEISANWDSNRVHCYQLDVRDAQQVTDRIKSFAEGNKQRLDLLFNCAGILQIDRFEDIRAERHQQIFDINVMGVIHGCQAAFPYLRNTPKSQVINMSSASATYGVPHMASYSASKFAIRGLTEALNIEWADHNISVTDIMPPFVNTHMVTSQTSESRIMQRLGVNLDASDITAAILAQIKNPKTHRAVSLQFQILYALNQITPAWLNRQMMRFLNRP